MSLYKKCVDYSKILESTKARECIYHYKLSVLICILETCNLKKQINKQMSRNKHRCREILRDTRWEGV